MRLTKVAIMAIYGGEEIKDRLMEEMDISPATLYRWLNKNDDNLTKAAALKVIREETGLTDEQILEEEPNTVNN
jgi:IS30 family transposase